MLDSNECSLLIAFPLFELGEREDAIVEEMCRYIGEKSYCIPVDELDNVIMGMYWNIVEYVENEKQDELLELIGVESKTEGVIEGLINQGFNQGFNEGIKSIINPLLEKNSLEEVADILEISVTELKDMIR